MTHVLDLGDGWHLLADTAGEPWLYLPTEGLVQVPYGTPYPDWPDRVNAFLATRPEAEAVARAAKLAYFRLAWPEGVPIVDAP